MRHPVSSSHACQHPQIPSQRIRIRLPLATVEELDHLAELQHLTRQQIIRQILTAGLLSDMPLRPAGAESVERIHVHAHLTHTRSLELAAGRTEA